MYTFEEIFEEIRNREARIATLACELRNELEALSENVRSLNDDETYYTKQGTEVDENGLQDWADAVSEIENEYFEE